MADPPGPDSSLRPPSSPMGDDHDTRSDRVEQEPGGASVIPGCDQPDPPRPEIETDTGVRARPDIDGDDSSTSTTPPQPAATYPALPTRTSHTQVSSSVIVSSLALRSFPDPIQTPPAPHASRGVLAPPWGSQASGMCSSHLRRGAHRMQLIFGGAE